MMWNKGKRKEKIVFLQPDRIVPNPWSPRRKFPIEEMDRLCGSITRYGIIEPLVVQKLGDEYQLLCGERRLRAAKLLELESVPCRVMAPPPKRRRSLHWWKTAFTKALRILRRLWCAIVFLRSFVIIKRSWRRGFAKAKVILVPN